MDQEKIKKKVKEIFESNEKITGVSFGYKKKDGKRTGEIGFLITVKEKKNVEELSPQEIIPQSYWVDGIEYPTDVIEIESNEFLACPSQCLVQSTYPNMFKQRPIMGGLSIGNSYGPCCGSGTMGFIAVDNVSNCLVGVTNSHVVMGIDFRKYYTSQWSVNSQLINGFSDGAAYQPGLYPTDGANPSTDGVGRLIRYVPQTPPTSYNKVDGAVMSLSGSVIDYNESFKQFGLSYNSPMEFATTSEINNLLSTHGSGGVYSSGRTTGPKGPGPCELKITSINGVVTFSDSWFEDSIFYERVNSDCFNPVRGGDSGSALIADFGGTWKIIGLVYMGAFNNSGVALYGGACRIDDVAELLDISAWDGGPNPVVSVVEYITVPGGSNNNMITCNGKEYWQIGMTAFNSQCT
jgi:hypothetical protein